MRYLGGVGSQAKALERLGADFEHYKLSEWEVHAVASYHKIHMKQDQIDYSAEFTDKELMEKLFELGISVDGKKPMSKQKIKGKGEKWHRRVYNDFMATHNIGSITNVHGKDLKIVDKHNYNYILCYSFPCQDISIAGKQKGFTKGEETRSGLLWEVERVLNETWNKPDGLLMENVPQIHSQKFMEDFQKWIKALEDMGYTNFWGDMNAKDYGVAQSRNRTFMISIYRQNVDYQFPKAISLDKAMKDYLEDEVDEKYYINSPKAKELIEKLLDSDTILDERTNERTNRQTIELTTNCPRQINVANCIKARYDEGIVNQKSSGSGVIEVTGGADRESN